MGYLQGHHEGSFREVNGGALHPVGGAVKATTFFWGLFLTSHPHTSFWRYVPGVTGAVGLAWWVVTSGKHGLLAHVDSGNPPLSPSCTSGSGQQESHGQAWRAARVRPGRSAFPGRCSTLTSLDADASGDWEPGRVWESSNHDRRRFFLLVSAWHPAGLGGSGSCVCRDLG